MVVLPGRTRKQGKFPIEIWVLVSANFIIAVGYGLVAPVLPTYAKSFGVSIAAAAAVVSLFSVMRLLFAPMSGRLVARFGERSTYFWGLLIVAASSAGCALAGTYWQLLVFRGLGGIGSTMFSVAGIGLLLRLTPETLRGRASGLWATTFLTGGIAGPLIGGVLVTVSMQLPFLCYAGALVLAACATAVALRRSVLAAKAAPSEDVVMTVPTALRHSAYRAALASSFANGWAMLGLRVALLPLFVTSVLRAPSEIVGVSLAVFAGGNAVMVVVSGRLADTMGRKPVALAGLVVSALATLGLGLAPSVPWFLVASVVAGLGAGLFTPAQTAAVADVLGVKARGGPVLAAFQMATDFGAVLGPVLAGVLAQATSFPIAFTSGAVLLAVAGFFWLNAREPLRSKASPAPTVSG